MDNQIHFEQTPYHHVYLKDRKTLELTGIKKIESFDSLEFLIETSLGYLNIKGTDLALVRFDQEKKAVCSSQQYVLVTERKQIHTSSIAYPATRG